MNSTDPATELEALHERAYAAMDAGRLLLASRHFERLLEHHPEDHPYHYMLGLAHKYRGDWAQSLRHNLLAIRHADEPDQASQWNAAIAATALGDWAQARRLWQACGVNVPEGDGPIEHDYGVAVVRLNPWSDGETLYVRRICPARGRILNVPLPESGHRFGDIVLHDGAPTGFRLDGERKIPVFNELKRMDASPMQTFAVFVRCGQPDDLQALIEATGPGIGFSEDWTSGVANYCLRCSYGTPHADDGGAAEGEAGEDAWDIERNLGIAAQSQRAVETLLRRWAAGGDSRQIDGIEACDEPVPDVEDGHVWWRGPDEEDDEAANEAG